MKVLVAGLVRPEGKEELEASAEVEHDPDLWSVPAEISAKAAPSAPVAREVFEVPRGEPSPCAVG